MFGLITRKMSMNRKGDISVTILVIGVFCICVFAMFSFLHSSFVAFDSFKGINYMENMNLVIENSSFNGNNLDSFYLYENKTYISPELSFNWIKEKTIFSVMYEKP
jgi:hypothetical protein